MKEDKEVDLLSVDIWDTVLRRNCHPDEIKFFTSRYIWLKYKNLLNDYIKDLRGIFDERIKVEQYLGMQCKKEGYDDEYSLKEVYQELLLRIFNKQDHIKISDISDEMIEVEYNHEKDMVRLDSSIINTMSEINAKKIVFISDFYADGGFIERLLSNQNFKIKFDNSFVSCDHKLNKRSGRLFTYVHEQLKISPENHVHIGDNIHSDVNIPNNLGIHTIHYTNPQDDSLREKNERLFSTRNQTIKPYIDELLADVKAKTQKKYGNLQQQNMYELGRRYSLIFYNFILYIIENLIQDNQDRVFYMTREGEFFSQIHNLIQKTNPLGVQMPRSDTIEVSRVATFAPSLKECSINELMRLWNQYSTQSMKALMISLNVPIEMFKPHFDKYGIDINKEIQYPWENENVIRLFQDKDFINKFNKKIAQKKTKLKEYFNQKDINQIDKTLSIVDIGWRGTIQDNLSYIFNQTRITGYYFNLFDFINEQPENIVKKGFINSYNNNNLHSLRFVAPFEMLCNSPNGSVIDYLSDKKGVTAEKIIDQKENSIHEKYISYFQEGVLSAIPSISQYIKVHSLTSKDLSPYTIFQLDELMTRPPRMITKAFFSLSHNENFGVGSFINKQVRFPVKLAIKAFLGQKNKKRFKEYIENTSWPQGFLTFYRLTLLNDYYNNHVKKALEYSQCNTIVDENYDVLELQQLINNQRKLLEERYIAIQDMEKMIKERDETISAQHNMVEERYRTIQEMDQMIKDRDNIINELQSSLVANQGK